VTSLDHLSTLAEVAIAIAGFSALVALLGTRVGRASPKLDAFRLQIMLEASLFVVALALLPLVVFELGAADKAGWRVSAALFLGADLLLTVFTLRRARRYRDLLQGADRALGVLVRALGYVGDVLVLIVVLGVVAEKSAGLYLAALYLNLLLAGILFVRFAASIFVPDE
jgi:hypothetical protein